MDTGVPPTNCVPLLGFSIFILRAAPMEPQYQMETSHSRRMKAQIATPMAISQVASDLNEAHAADSDLTVRSPLSLAH